MKYNWLVQNIEDFTTMKHTWQYNGQARMDTILQWCKANLQGEFTAGGWAWSFDQIYFDRDADYTLFLLRWGP